MRLGGVKRGRAEEDGVGWGWEEGRSTVQHTHMKLSIAINIPSHLAAEWCRVVSGVVKECQLVSSGPAECRMISHKLAKSEVYLK